MLFHADPSPSDHTLVPHIVLLLLALSLADALATDAGLLLDLITEANPIMAAVHEESRLLFYSVKLAGPSLLLLFPRRVTASSPVRRILFAALFFYSSVMMLHAAWLLLSLLLHM